MRLFLEDLDSLHDNKMVNSIPWNLSVMPSSIINKLTASSLDEAWVVDYQEQENIPLSEL